VVILDDLSTGSTQNLNPKAEFVQMDVSGPGLMDFLASGKFEVINHHAAQVSVPQSVKDPEHDLRVNGLGTLNLLQGAVKSGVKRFIFISSGGAVYGEQEHLPVNETARPQPLSPYAVHKLLGESYLPAFASQFDLEYVVLRYANVYGPRQVAHAEAGVAVIFLTALARGEKPFIYRYPDQPQGMIRDYVFVEDVVAANVAALERGAGGIYNIATGVATSTLDLWLELVGAWGGDQDHEFGPPRPGDLKRSLLDNSLARRELGWQPRVDLAQGCGLTAAWHRQQAGS
jgi:UDP-glucose 4-epimerase